MAIMLLAGCSDPAGAARREQQQAARAHPTSPGSPRPSPAAPRSRAWWQAAQTTRIVGPLRVRTGTLRGGRMKISVTDLGSHTRRLLTAAGRPNSAVVGRYVLSRIRITAKLGRFGVAFRYRAR